MIDIEKLTKEDLGRGVVYQSKAPGTKPEDGYVASWNRFFVFVNFGGTNSKACRPEDLVWLASPTAERSL